MYLLFPNTSPDPPGATEGVKQTPLSNHLHKQLDTPAPCHIPTHADNMVPASMTSTHTLHKSCIDIPSPPHSFSFSGALPVSNQLIAALKSRSITRSPQHHLNTEYYRPLSYITLSNNHPSSPIPRRSKKQCCKKLVPPVKWINQGWWSGVIAPTKSTQRTYDHDYNFLPAHTVPRGARRIE